MLSSFNNLMIIKFIKIKLYEFCNSNKPPIRNYKVREFVICKISTMTDTIDNQSSLLWNLPSRV